MLPCSCQLGIIDPEADPPEWEFVRDRGWGIAVYTGREHIVQIARFALSAVREEGTMLPCWKTDQLYMVLAASAPGVRKPAATSKQYRARLPVRPAQTSLRFAASALVEVGQHLDPCCLHVKSHHWNRLGKRRSLVVDAVALHSGPGCHHGKSAATQEGRGLGPT